MADGGDCWDLCTIHIDGGSYEIKTGLSRAKLSHLMDAETWMDANSAIELGFADEIMQRNTQDDIEVPNVSMTFSRASVTNSLMEKVAEKCKISQKTKNEIASDSLLERLELIRNWR